MTLDNSLLKKIEDFKSFIANMIPIAGNNTPNADTTNGNVGNGTTWARSDHSHPKSSLYAEASHVHNEYLTSQDIVNKVDKVTGKDLSTNDFTDSYKDKLDLNFGYVDHNLKLHFVEVDEATLSSSPNVAMNGGITNIMAHITDSENNNVVDAPIDFYQDNVYYDTGITNNNGLASIEYFGNGIGQTNFTVKCGSFQSEPYPVIDSLYYDSAISDNKSNYTVGSGMTISHSNGKYTVQCSASYRRLNFYVGSDMLALLKGKTIKFRCSIETSNNVQLILYVNNTSATSTANTSVDATLETSSYTIPSDATGVRFEIAGTVSQPFSFKDFVIYVG